MEKYVGLKFPLEIDASTGRLKTVADDDAVKQSVKTIISTNHGERLMRDGFGTNLNEYMFGTIDLSLVARMNESITDALKLWEENIVELNVRTTPLTHLGTEMKIEVSYKTRFTLERQNFMTINQLAL